MNRGPERGRSRVDHRGTAATAWSPVPDWIEALAEAAMRSTGTAVAARIGYSPAVVSDVLRNKYRGDIGRVEQAVRGALMGETVTCPVLGAIGRDRCVSEQRAPFRAASSLTVRLYSACRAGCPNAFGRQEVAE